MKIKKIINHGCVWGDHYHRLDGLNEKGERITMRGIACGDIGEVDLVRAKKMEWVYDYRGVSPITGNMEWRSCIELEIVS